MTESEQTDFVPLGKEEAELFYQARKIEGRLIALHPYAAEVWLATGVLVTDPYRIHGPVPDEFQQVSRHYFASLPGVTNEVSFRDIPEDTRAILLERLKTENVGTNGRIAPVKARPAPVLTPNEYLEATGCAAVPVDELRPIEELQLAKGKTHH
jgi:hypothetical protein